MKFQKTNLFILFLLVFNLSSCTKTQMPSPSLLQESAPIDKKTFETLTLRMAEVKEKDPSISPLEALEKIKIICYEEGFPFVSSKDFLDKYTASAMVYRMDADLILGMVDRKCDLTGKQKL